jgi:hypothetical protein
MSCTSLARTCLGVVLHDIMVGVAAIATIVVEAATTVVVLVLVVATLVEDLYRRLLDIVGYSTSSATQHRRLLDIVGYSTSSVIQHRQPCPQSK